MKVLFYEDPVSEPGAFLWNVPHIQLDTVWLNYLVEAGVDARMLASTSLAPFLSGIDSSRAIVADPIRPSAFDDHPHINVNTIFQRYYLALSGGASADVDMPRGAAVAGEMCRSLQETASSLLQNFTPDVIVTWNPVPHLRKLFPAALILHKETGLFSRTPYPLTYSLDPIGFGRWSSMATGATMAVSPEELKRLVELRMYFDKAFDRTDALQDTMSKLAAFRQSILLPLQRSGFFMFDGASTYRSQGEMVHDVMNHAPTTCGVVVTDHPGGIPLTAIERAHFSERYPNFIHLRSDGNWRQVAQHVLRKADGVATVGSTLGLQAIFWNKPLVALGQSMLNSCAQGVGAAAINDAISRTVSTDAAAAWLTYRYCYQEDLARSPGWLAQHLRERLIAWRRNGPVGYFDAPFAEPAHVNETAISASARRLASSEFGLVVGRVPTEPDSIDMAADGAFAAGWGSVEFNHGKAYRWMVGLQGEIDLAMALGADRCVMFELGSLAEIPIQIVEWGTGDKSLASTTITNGRTTQVSVRVAREDLNLPVTRLWLRASSTEQPAHDTRQLSVIVFAIRLTSA